MDTFHWDVFGCFIWDLSETSWRRTDETSSLRPLETSSRHNNKTSWRRTTDTSWWGSTETSLGVSFDITCNIDGTYRETSLRRYHNVFLPGGLTFPYILTLTSITTVHLQKKSVSGDNSIFRPFHILTCYQHHNDDVTVKIQAILWRGWFKSWLRPRVLF